MHCIRHVLPLPQQHPAYRRSYARCCRRLCQGKTVRFRLDVHNRQVYQIQIHLPLLPWLQIRLLHHHQKRSLSLYTDRIRYSHVQACRLSGKFRSQFLLLLKFFQFLPVQCMYCRAYAHCRLTLKLSC